MKLRELRRLSMGSVIWKEEYIKSFQDVRDITKQLRRAEYNSRAFSRKLKQFFVNDDEKKICRRVWTFLRVYIRYEAESKDKQTAKTIPRFFVDQKGDCKHYAVSSVGILTACGVPAWFSVVRQSEDKTRWHVYASALVNGEVVIVDPCRKIFNSECRYEKKYNIPPIKQTT